MHRIALRTINKSIKSALARSGFGLRFVCTRCIWCTVSVCVCVSRDCRRRRRSRRDGRRSGGAGELSTCRHVWVGVLHIKCLDTLLFARRTRHQKNGLCDWLGGRRGRASRNGLRKSCNDSKACLIFFLRLLNTSWFVLLDLFKAQLVNRGFRIRYVLRIWGIVWLEITT